MEILTNEQYLLNRIEFSLLLALQIPSIGLSLFIFAFFITHHILLHKLQHQALLFLFIVNSIQLSFDLPMVIHFYRLNCVSPATGIYCKWWIFLEDTLDAASELLVATISIQRHILVFHPNILRTRLKQYTLYYLPLLLCIVYPIIFYMATVVFYPCNGTKWDFTSNKCGDTTCYLNHNQILAAFDWIVNTALLTAVIMLANIALIIRVIRQKYRRQQAISWSKQRRMTLQLLSISSLYLITWSPSTIIGLAQQLNPSNILFQILKDHISDLTYLICLLLPWICLGQIPELNKWIWKQFRRLKQLSNAVRLV